jgi:catechol 2,3-dioxygenase-like lactoylglutathione lyase family enzyme
MQPKNDRPTMHLSLRVTNLARSVAFYRDLLDHEPAKLKADYAKFEHPDPPLALSLVPAPQAAGAAPETGPETDGFHLGIRLGSAPEVEVQAERLRRLGRILDDEGETNCCYALQRKFWVHDPDGRAWEIYHLIEDTEPGYDRAASCCVPQTAQGETAESR